MDDMHIEFTPEFIDYYEKNIKKHYVTDYFPAVEGFTHEFLQRFFEFKAIVEESYNIIEESKEDPEKTSELYFASGLIAKSSFEAEELEKIAENLHNCMKIINVHMGKIRNVMQNPEDGEENAES